MSRYRKRPVEVEAEQWFPGREVPGVQFEEVGGMDATNFDGPARVGTVLRAYVTTIHGRQAHLDPGDWVIREPDGVHFYPCKPAVFEQNYEPC